MNNSERMYDNVPKSSDGPQAEESDWSKRITRTVARQVRRWRERRDLSAQQLSDRTRDLGFVVPRSVIANLENNRRDSVSIAEVLVLAAALDVAPGILIAAVGMEEALEVLPGKEVSPWVARGWVIGALAPDYVGHSPRRWQESRRAVVLYDIHRLLVREHQQAQARIERLVKHGAIGPTTDEVPTRDRGASMTIADAVTELLYSVDRIRTHRDLIRREGFLAPELPPALARMLRETDSSGRHQAVPGEAPQAEGGIPAAVLAALSALNIGANDGDKER